MNDFKYEVLYSYKPEEELDVKIKTTYKGEEKIEINLEEALSVLLIEKIVFVNSPWWEKEWPEKAKNTIGFHVNCNDVFVWGAADAETMYFDDIEEVFEYYMKDNIWGAVIWCIKKRGIMPQKPVYEKIQSLGKWDLDSMELEKNDFF